MRVARTTSLGFTLIELMVALAIGSFLTLGAVAVFVQTSETQKLNDSLGRLQENTRFALEVMENDIRLAGFWGRTNETGLVERRRGQPNQLPDIDDCGDRWYIDVNVPLAATNNANPLGAASVDPCIADAGYRNDTDVLVVRRASAQQTALQAGVLQIHTDIGRARLFTDGVAPTGFAATARTHDMVAHAYYINDAGAVPALHRIELTAGPAVTDTLLMNGVEDLQVQLGVDSDGDTAADSFVNPGSEPPGALVVAVKLWLLVRSETPEVGYVDDATYVYGDVAYTPSEDDPTAARSRRVLISRTVQLRNRQASPL